MWSEPGKGFCQRRGDTAPLTSEGPAWAKAREGGREEGVPTTSANLNTIRVNTANKKASTASGCWAPLQPDVDLGVSMCL